MQKQRGVTLLELLIVIAIVGVLASIANSGYRGYMVQSHRGSVTSTLLDLAQRQEKYFLENGAYTASLDDLGSAADAPAHYRLSVTTPSTGEYTLSATATPEGPQSVDTGCTTLSLNHLGQGMPADCW